MEEHAKIPALSQISDQLPSPRREPGGSEGDQTHRSVGSVSSTVYGSMDSARLDVSPDRQRYSGTPCESPRSGFGSPKRLGFESPESSGFESPKRPGFESPKRHGFESPKRPGPVFE